MKATVPKTAKEWAQLEQRIRCILGSLVTDHDDLADVTQLCLITVWRRSASFQGRSAFSSWLYRVVRNEHISWIRRRTRYSRGRALLAANGSSTQNDPLDATVLDRVSADRRLAGFSAENRRILELLCFSDWTSTQVGEELGLAPSSVRCRLHRARRRIASQGCSGAQTSL